MVQTYRITSTVAGVTRSVNIKKYILDFYAVQLECSVSDAKDSVRNVMRYLVVDLGYDSLTADLVSERMLIQVNSKTSNL